MSIALQQEIVHLRERIEKLETIVGMLGAADVAEVEAQTKSLSERLAAYDTKMNAVDLRLKIVEGPVNIRRLTLQDCKANV